MLLDLTGIIVSSLILIKSADLVLISLKRLVGHNTSHMLFVSAILVAVGTSLPELFVGIGSGLSNATGLTLGNVLGANVANISLIVGIATLISGKVTIHSEFIRKEVPVTFAVGLLPFILLLDGNLTRLDGVILLFAYGIYLTSFFTHKRKQVKSEHDRGSFFVRFFREVKHIEIKGVREYIKLAIGVALLLVSSKLVISSATSIASALGLPLFLVGLFIVSIGTTLPELVFSIESLRDGKPIIFMGNILGSIVANSTLVLGLALVISPITETISKENMVATLFFVLIFALFWFFVRVKTHITRLEGLVLLISYLAFAVVEFI